MTDIKALVCVVDDDEAVRLSIEMLIASVGYRVQGYPDAMSLLLDEHHLREANCIILDVRMPGLSGIAAHEKLVNLQITVPVIFVSGHGDVPMVAKAMRNGACDFIQKPFNEQDLLDRVQDLITLDRARRENRARHDRIEHRIKQLTKREAEVLEGMLLGRLNKQIADDLGINMKTVEQHRARIMEKMAVNSFAELVRDVTLFREVHLSFPAPPEIASRSGRS